MGSFWNMAFGIMLVILWIVAGGFITQANVFLTKFKDQDDHMNRAYWFSFWAAFVTWFLVGVFIILIILSVAGVVALFASGAGEAAGGAEVAAEGTEVAIEGEEEAQAAVKIAESRSKRAKNAIKSPRTREAIKGHGSGFTIGFLVFALILVGITGVLSVLTASNLVASPNYKPNDSKQQTIHKDAIVAASISLGAGGLVIIGLIIYAIVGANNSRKRELEEKERQEPVNEQQEKTEELKEQQEKTKQLKDMSIVEKLRLAQSEAYNIQSSAQNIRDVYNSTGLSRVSVRST